VTNKLKMTLLLVFWAAVFFILGTMSAVKADNIVDYSISPAYHFLPQNIYYNDFHGNDSDSNINKFDKCKNPGTVQKVLVEKSKKTLTLLDVNDCVVKQYKNIRLGKNKGPKTCDGDKRTPEGIYHITGKRDSKYYRFLALDYPQAKDLKKAKELGCYAGDSIGIHYYNKEFAKTNDELYNSLGCITVYSKQELSEINKLVNIGTVVEIVP